MSGLLIGGQVANLSENTTIDRTPGNASFPDPASRKIMLNLREADPAIDI